MTSLIISGKEKLCLFNQEIAAVAQSFIEHYSLLEAYIHTDSFKLDIYADLNTVVILFFIISQFSPSRSKEQTKQNNQNDIDI